MRFETDIIARLVEGDATALKEPVEFEDGTVKALRDCDVYDLNVMSAWVTFKAAEAQIRLDQLDEQERNRRAPLRAVPHEVTS